jgi:hypothetical protein
MSLKETLSSSVLFTFTQELDFLLDMLENGIKPRYSFESFPNNSMHYILPMKCFCDIPLSKTKVHLDWYGNYGLGIRQETLKKIGVTPVLYVHASSVKEIIKPLLKNSNNEKIVALTKKYFGTIYRLNEENNYVRTTRKFYDEREWRYIPLDSKIEWLPSDTKIEHGLLNAQKKNKENPYKGKPIDLVFQDIEYIIIKDLKEVDKLKKVLSNKFPNAREYELLMTKVLTAKQIIKDF